MVAQGQPAWHAVVGAAEELDLFAAGVHALDDAVDLIRLATGLAHLAYNNVAVQTGIDAWVSLDSDKAVLFGVVEPVASLTCDDQPVDLVGLDPYDLVNSAIAPFCEALTT